MGQPTSIVDATGAERSWTWNVYQQPATYMDPDGDTTTWSHAGARYMLTGEAELTGVTDPAGGETTLGLDATGRVVSRTEPTGDVTTFSWDSRDNLLEVVDAAGSTTSWEYDLLDRVEATTWPDGSTESFGWDAEGRPLTWERRDGRIVRWTWDAAGRLSTRETDTGSIEVYTWDANGKLAELTVDGSDTWSFAYDEAGRTIQTVDAFGRTVTITYDAAGRRSQVLRPDGTQLTYEYDPAGGLLVMAEGSSPAITYTRDSLGRIVDRQLANGVHTVQTWNDDGQVDTLQTAFTRGPLASYGYDYDSRGNRVEETLPRGSTDYDYDDKSRLVAVTRGPFWETYAYDEVDSRTGWETGTRSVSWSINELHQPLEETDGTDSRSYGWAADGNAQSLPRPGGSMELVHDGLGRLVEAVLPDGREVAYTYDPFGRPVTRTLGAIEERFAWDGPHLIEIADASGRVLATFDYGSELDEPVRMTAGGRDHWYTLDGHGSVTGISDTHGRLLETVRYEAFGEPRFEDPDGNPIPRSLVHNPLLFTGRRFDEATGLYDYRARTYDPYLGRFLEPDPARWVEGMNPYLFVRNNPLTRVDPFGTKSVFDKARERLDILDDFELMDEIRDKGDVPIEGPTVDLDDVKDSVGDFIDHIEEASQSHKDGGDFTNASYLDFDPFDN